MLIKPDIHYSTDDKPAEESHLNYIKTTSSSSPNCAVLEMMKQRVALISVLSVEL